MNQSHRVVIVGGGFGGLHAALSLKKAPVQITLIDRRNFHLFQPLLYQVATGQLSPANIASPLRSILKHQKNARVLMGEVTGFDLTHHRVLLRDGAVVYDTLIVAAGSRHHYFGHDQWEKLAPGLKTVEDATDMRSRILRAFETAEREPDPDKRRAWLTFVIVGGGPTGVELAGALGELSRHTLRRDFRSIQPAQAQILLIEGENRLLPPYTPDLAAKAATVLARLGVKVRTGCVVTDVQPDAVAIRCGEQTEKIPTHTVLWAAGVQSSPLGRAIAEAAEIHVDRAGRIAVNPDLSLPGHPEIFIIGDMAACPGANGKPIPAVAPVAVQQGRYMAELIQNRLQGKPTAPFRYRDIGMMTTIGRTSAIVDLGWIRFNGFAAWMVWLLVHLMNLVQFENRLLVLLQWAWYYLTRDRSARLITGEKGQEKE